MSARNRPLEASPEIVGARLKAAREARGWNQVQLCAAVGMHPGEISLYEHGTRDMRLSRFRAICRELGVEPAHILRPVGKDGK